jgi:UDP-N-acetylglucosamine 2-epimerase
MAPLMSESIRFSEINLEIITTGQHYDYEMSKLINELSLPDPVINLEIGSGSHGFQTARRIIELENTYLALELELVIFRVSPIVPWLVPLTSAKLGISVAHIEAKCRSFAMGMLEETNWKLTDHCSSILFIVSTWAIIGWSTKGYKG